MLKYTYENKDEIPAAIASFYTEADAGKWVLNCEGAVPAARLTEATKQVTELRKQAKAFEGIDPAEHADLVARKATYEAAQADNQTKVAELVDKRVAKIKETADAQIAALEAANTAQQKKLHSLQIDGTMLATATELGLRKSAAADLVSRARAVWKLGAEDTPVAFSGEEQIFGKTGGPITPKEWLEGLAKDAPHLFAESKGGGTGGSGAASGANPNTANPWKEGQINITEQARIFKEDKVLASRMAMQAGKRLKI